MKRCVSVSFITVAMADAGSGLPETASVYCLALGKMDLFAGTEEGEV